MYIRTCTDINCYHVQENMLCTIQCTCTDNVFTCSNLISFSRPVVLLFSSELDRTRSFVITVSFDDDREVFLSLNQSKTLSAPKTKKHNTALY